MKKSIHFIAFMFFLLAACNCTGSSQNIVAPVHDKPPVAWTAERNAQIAFLKHIEERTVQVRFGCDPKDNVVIIGLNDAQTKTYGDSRGSGTIVKSKPGASYIFTAAHVVLLNNENEEKAFTCKVTIILDSSVDPTQRHIPAEIVVVNRDRDLAVLKVSEDLGLSAGLETDPKLGETVWAVGYPVQLYNRGKILPSITSGELATRFVPSRDVKNKGYYHRVSSPVYFGNSGGGVWSKEGKLIGIVCFLFTDPHGQAAAGYYYVKPVNEVLVELHDNWKYHEVFGD